MPARRHDDLRPLRFAPGPALGLLLLATSAALQATALGWLA